MREVAFPELAGVLPGFGYHNPNDWGLGPEIRGTKAPHWTGHGKNPLFKPPDGPSNCDGSDRCRRGHM